MRPINVLFAAFALLQAMRYARRALLFLLPSTRIAGEAGAEPRSALRLRLGSDLEELGFSSLGIQYERAALGAIDREADVYVDVARGTFADVVQVRRPDGPGSSSLVPLPAVNNVFARVFAAVVRERSSDSPGVLFVTPFADGALVLTAAFQRPAFASPTVQIGSMPDVRLPAVLKAHEVAVRRFSVRHGAPSVAADLESRLAAARRWAGGEGRRELRRAHAVGFAIFVLGLLIFVSSLKIFVLGAK